MLRALVLLAALLFPAVQGFAQVHALEHDLGHEHAVYSPTYGMKQYSVHGHGCPVFAYCEHMAMSDAVPPPPIVPVTFVEIEPPPPFAVSEIAALEVSGAFPRGPPATA
jgi:hypothetical protein